MAGVYPAIASSCMATAKITSNTMKKWLIIFSVLQITAWGLRYSGKHISFELGK